METPCPARRLIAEGPACSVEECACGVLLVTMGPLTIRVPPEAVASIWQTLGAALQKLSAIHRSPHSTVDGHTSPSVSTERPS
jgi:hypothetical protein